MDSFSSSDSAVFARHVLAINDRGTHIIPAKGIYPHQWFWDSCFIAIGLRHYDIERSKKILLSLKSGQWKNGMIPNIIFHGLDERSRHIRIWDSSRNPYAPKHLRTSGITQPPMLAEAVFKVGEKLNPKQKKDFFEKMLPSIVKYHEWIYRERDPHGEGLALLLHPWESGTDNAPHWMQELYYNQAPLWIRLIDIIGLEKLIDIARPDSRLGLAISERARSVDELLFFSVQRRLKRKRYDIHSILRHAQLAIEDLTFNSILVRANAKLEQISDYCNKPLPRELLTSIHKTPHALELLWDGKDRQYYSRNFTTHELIREPTIGTLLPLYSGTVKRYRAIELVRIMKDKRHFWTDYPLPTVPKSSKNYQPKRYWQGPTWLNMNWLVIEGLKNYGFKSEADTLIEKTRLMVEQAGMREYFNSQTGQGLGGSDFSWTAALYIDLLNSKN